ncbi:ferredoxin [Patescibacteria group bacterium]|nr:ferredoxin [Patescibacteria group bacterium]
MALKVKVDRMLCIGTSDCVAIAPNTFVLDDEAKAVVKKQNGDSDEKILEAAKVCPVLAIIVEDEDGNQVYP